MMTADGWGIVLTTIGCALLTVGCGMVGGLVKLLLDVHGLKKEVVMLKEIWGRIERIEARLTKQGEHLIRVEAKAFGRHHYHDDDSQTSREGDR